MKYASEFKCRICGTLVRGTAKEMDGKELLKANRDGLMNGKTTMYWVHTCKDGSIGLCDFQGHRAMVED